MNYSWLPPGRYVVNADGRPVKTKSARKQVLEGWACHFGVVHTNFRTGLPEVFHKGCFDGTIYDCPFLRDHVLTEKAIGEQSDGSLELHSCEQGLAFRLHLKAGDLEKLNGRTELSVGYHVVESHLRKDAVRVIDKAILIEVSACNVGAVTQTWSEIREANDIGPLETDSKHWASEGAARGFLRALRKLT